MRTASAGHALRLLCALALVAWSDGSVLCDSSLTPMEFKCPKGLEADSLDDSQADPKGNVEGTDPKFRILACTCKELIQGQGTTNCPKSGSLPKLFEGYFLSCSSDPNSAEHRNTLKDRYLEFQTKRADRVNVLLQSAVLKKLSGKSKKLGETLQVKMKAKSEIQEIMLLVDHALRKAIGVARSHLCVGSIKSAQRASLGGTSGTQNTIKKKNSAKKMAQLINEITNESVPNYEDAWDEISATVIDAWNDNLEAAGLSLVDHFVRGGKGSRKGPSQTITGGAVSGSELVTQEDGSKKSYRRLVYSVERNGVEVTTSTDGFETFLVRIDKDCNTPEFMLSVVTQGKVAQVGGGGFLSTTGSFTLSSGRL